MALARRKLVCAAALTAFATCGRVMAQAPMLTQAKLVVGFPPGSVPDAIARLLAEGMRGAYARVTLVENKTGSSGRIPVDETFRGPSDGSVMLVAPDASLTQIPHSDPKNSPYKPEDFEPVCAIGHIDHALAIGPQVSKSVRTMKDFIEWARANPTLANFGTPGFGSAHDILMQIAMKEQGFTLTHIPYRGAALGVQDALGGQLAAVFAPLGTLLPHLGAKGMRLLATTGDRRSRFVPDVPTFAEQGFSGLVLTGWYGVWMKKGTPAAIVANARAAINATLAKPDSVALLERIAVEVDPRSAEVFAGMLRDAYRSWADRVRKSGYKPEI